VATIAAVLKVPVRKLEALEEDHYEELPDAVFARGLAASYCRTLKIDPGPVLALLPHNPQPQLAKLGESINAPFRAPNDAPPPGLLNQVSRPVVLTVLALLLGALVLILLPFVQRGFESVVAANRSEAPALATTARPEQPTTAPAPAASAIAGVPAAPASAAGAVPTPAAVTLAPEAAPAASAAGNGVQLRTSASTTPPVAAAAPAPRTAVSEAPVAAAAGADQGIVVFRARAESWVQVKDARGATVLQKLLAAGETAGATGALPLAVTVGSVQATEVQVRGKPFDLAPLARDNVARFEVK
jgi:cytoskeleton protein RodZ